MNITTAKPSAPVRAWAGLLGLTFISIVLGEKFGHASWMPLLVAAIIWVKGTVVARYFLESHMAHPFIAWVLRTFIAFAPVALMLTAFLQRTSNSGH